MKKPKISIDILTIFPKFFDSPLKTSLLGKALSKNLIDIRIHDIRNFGIGRSKQVDDKPFGGGPGMVLKPDVLLASLKAVTSKGRTNSRGVPHVILLDPTGKKLDQEKAEALLRKGWLILIAGHYEGVDQRFKENFVDEEISIGDYVLSGGETASLVLIDSISRLITGFVGRSESVKQESFSRSKIERKNVRLLDHPVYTRPALFEGKAVPEILLSGDHERIRTWRRKKALETTKKRRPDLLEE